MIARDQMDWSLNLCAWEPLMVGDIGRNVFWKINLDTTYVWNTRLNRDKEATEIAETFK